MADYRLLAQYPKQQCVRDRNFGGLVAWSAYETAIDVPTTKPSADWTRLRIVAEQIPLQTNMFVDQTISYFLADPTTAVNVREYLSEWNSEATEQSLSDQMSGVIGSFMPRFAALTVTDSQVQAWWDANGFADLPAEPAPE